MEPHRTTVLLHSDSVAATLALGRWLGESAAAGDVLGLVGPLGAGKTQLVKGIASGLGVVDERVVVSPTFVLVNEYDGRLHIYHLDAYRLERAAELAALGFDEMCTAGGVVVVEWADKVRRIMPEETVWISIEPTGETRRQIEASAAGAGLERLARLLPAL